MKMKQILKLKAMVEEEEDSEVVTFLDMLDLMDFRDDLKYK